MIKVKGKVVQISMHPKAGKVFAHAAGPGKRVRLLVMPDHSAKTSDAAHPVLQFEAFADTAGCAIELPDHDPKNAVLKGAVASIHFSRHGEPNGVMLATGEFIHLRPSGMERARLQVGSKVSATGELRMTVVGSPLLEAHTVNRLEMR